MPNFFRYQAYGLKIDSEFELPELGSPLEREGDADFSIRIAPVAHFGTEGGGERDGIRWVDPQSFWLHVDCIGHFLVSNGRDIRVMPDIDAEMSSVRVYLLGSVCGALLVQRGFLVLHGNAIRIGDSCLVCVGDSGAGKSTLAAGFQKRGFDILADDVVAVDAQGRAISGFPRMKLWQDAADFLGYSTQGRSRVFPEWDKYNLPIDVFDPDLRLPIRWIYHLSYEAVEEVSIEPISGMQRFHLLRENTYRCEYLESNMQLSNHLKQCSELSEQVQLFKLVRPDAGFSLNYIIDRLLESVSENASRP